MFILKNLLLSSLEVINIVLTFLYWLIITYALISWVNPDSFNPIVQFLYKTNEPILYPIRKILALDFRFGIDISPIIASLIIIFLKSF